MGYFHVLQRKASQLPKRLRLFDDGAARQEGQRIGGFVAVAEDISKFRRKECVEDL